jgi:holliday junction DNA helicase RuvA
VMAMGAGALATAMGKVPAADEFDVIETPAVKVSAPSASAQAEALSALSNLGYAPSEAASAVAEAAGTDLEATTSVLIRLALKLLAPKG